MHVSVRRSRAACGHGWVIGEGTERIVVGGHHALIVCARLRVWCVIGGGGTERVVVSGNHVLVVARKGDLLRLEIGAVEASAHHVRVQHHQIVGVQEKS